LNLTVGLGVTEPGIIQSTDSDCIEQRAVTLGLINMILLAFLKREDSEVKGDIFSVITIPYIVSDT
jgi:hypothetical protein